MSAKRNIFFKAIGTQTMKKHKKLHPNSSLLLCTYLRSEGPPSEALLVSISTLFCLSPLLQHNRRYNHYIYYHLNAIAITNIIVVMITETSKF